MRELFEGDQVDEVPVVSAFFRVIGVGVVGPEPTTEEAWHATVKQQPLVDGVGPETAERHGMRR